MSGRTRRSDTWRLRTTRIGLVGLGSVGSEVARILLERSSHLTRKTGRYLRLLSVVERNPTRLAQVALPDDVTVSGQLDSLIKADDIKTVVTLVGGVEEEEEIVRRLIEAGKSVVTANEDLMALRGSELVQLAREKGTTLCFGGTVGGGMPLISSLRDALVANQITALFGILSVTANVILTAMLREGLTLDEALERAKTERLVESNPDDDVGGLDTAHKLTILAGLLFPGHVDLSDLYIEGIGDLTPGDLQAADRLGYTVKLLATGIPGEDGLDLRVHPTLVPNDHLLAGVEGRHTALFCMGDAAGPLLFSGFEAEPRATASSVVADIVNLSLGREEITFRDSEMFPVAPHASIKDIMTRSGVCMLCFHGVAGANVHQQILELSRDQGLSVESALLVSDLSAVLLGPVTEDQALTFGRGVVQRLGVRDFRMLRMIDSESFTPPMETE